jgi:hypothetical protein
MFNPATISTAVRPIEVRSVHMDKLSSILYTFKPDEGSGSRC